MDGATAPDMATLPSWRAMGEDKNSPEKSWLMGEAEAEVLAVVVGAALETGGQGASTILRNTTRETAVAGRVGLGAAATGTGESATNPKPTSRRGV